MNISVQSKDVGKEVLCETKRGEQAGMLASENFIVHERAAKAISAGCGGYWPVANVLGITKKVTTTVTERFNNDATKIVEEMTLINEDGTTSVKSFDVSKSTDVNELPFSQERGRA
jgi:hypothetical protein